jgi:hypothetical protein
MPPDASVADPSPGPPAVASIPPLLDAPPLLDEVPPLELEVCPSPEVPFTPGPALPPQAVTAMRPRASTPFEIHHVAFWPIALYQYERPPETSHSIPSGQIGAAGARRVIKSVDSGDDAAMSSTRMANDAVLLCVTHLVVAAAVSSAACSSNGAGRGTDGGETTDGSTSGTDAGGTDASGADVSPDVSSASPDSSLAPGSVHVWEMVEITLTGTGTYGNPYTDVDVWVNLKGPGFSKKVWGFWDGQNATDATFRVRVVATAPGSWTWSSGSNQPADAGLNSASGSFSALDWTEADKQANPNRRGFVSASPSGHALSYADGTPFFLLADTEWSGLTYRIPFKGVNPPPDFSTDPSLFSFEGEIAALKKLGFNSIAMIATSPAWNSDTYPLSATDGAGVEIRSCKPESNSMVCRDMHDEASNRPFLFPGKCVGLTSVCPDYDRLDPGYFRSIDKKMGYLSDAGFVPYLETVRRDHAPVWAKYHDFNTSFPRFLNYMRARYGAYNIIYSLAHIDDGTDLPYPTFQGAMNAYYQRYGDMPFGQIVTVMAASSTLANIGPVSANPWLKAHAVGNTPKDHGMEQNLAACFQQTPPVPGFSNEPHYVGFPVNYNFPAGEPIASNNSDTDNYLARAHAYGLVLNGGLAGHITGTGSRWDNTTTEPASDPNYPPPWVTLNYVFTTQARYLATLMLSEGAKYQDLLLASSDLSAPTPAAFPVNSLQGWAHMMRTADKKLALLYFESQAQKQTLANMLAAATYQAEWFDPRAGAWSGAGSGSLQADGSGRITLPDFPGATPGGVAPTDWALKLTAP